MAPPYPIEYAPLFCWPPRPKATLKWLFGYPGFIWPWHLLFFLITAATWFWLQPSLERCATLPLDKGFGSFHDGSFGAGPSRP